MSGLGSGAGDSGVVGGGSAAPNLVSEFEASYQSILATLTQEDFLFTKQEEDKIGQFMDIARQIETFFLQKR